MTTETIQIDRATPADLAQVFALLAASDLPTDGLAEHWQNGVVARADGEVVASAAVELYGGEALLRSVAVAPTHRGRGLGQAVARRALEVASAAGARRVYLLTTTAADFFPRLGFRPIARDEVGEGVQASVELTSACPESAQAMVLELAAEAACCGPTCCGGTPARAPAPIKLGLDIHTAVRERYGQAAQRVLDASGPATCGCGTSCCSSGVPSESVITGGLYDAAEAAEVPSGALQASLGCGNPTALIDLRPGETVLDLGSGGGIDVLLSARRVGPEGKAYGVDMTDQMLELARRNAAEAGATNVEFLKGRIESVPLPDGAVDVVISNCVINLAPDKREVLREAFRVLRPGGRFAVSDVVVDGPVPTALRRRVELWVGCIAGALERGEYQRLLAEVGFEEIEIVPTRRYRAADVDPELVALLDQQPPAERARLEQAFMSAFVRARKPAG